MCQSLLSLEQKSGVATFTQRRRKDLSSLHSTSYYVSYCESMRFATYSEKTCHLLPTSPIVMNIKLWVFLQVVYFKGMYPNLRVKGGLSQSHSAILSRCTLNHNITSYHIIPSLQIILSQHKSSFLELRPETGDCCCWEEVLCSSQLYGDASTCRQEKESDFILRGWSRGRRAR